MQKKFLYWYHNKRQNTVSYDEIKNEFFEDTDSIIESVTSYFDVDKDKNLKLNKKFELGIIQIKKTIAFLLNPEGNDTKIDLFDLNGAMNQDLVLVNHYSYDPFVVMVVHSHLTKILAEVKIVKKNIFLDSKETEGKTIVCNNLPNFLVEGHVIYLNITEITKTKIYTEFIEIIGHKNDPDMEIVKIIYQYEWPMSFPSEVIEELDSIKIDEKYEYETRTDLTNEFIITIDGADAKDLDDAISLVKLDDKTFKLGVHIADVSYFVKEKSNLDKEAYRRATSVYLADRVIPMIPHGLSNDLCSLNPNELKYTLTCEMILDNDLNLLDHKIFASIIKSSHRLTYDEVNQFLNNQKSLGSSKLDDMITMMDYLAKKLKAIRTKRGALDFESTEIKFKLDEMGNVLELSERHTDHAEALIESYMILANETVATHFVENKLPGIYRIHEKPDQLKLDTAYTTLKKIGFNTDKNAKSTSKILQKYIKDANDSKYEYIVHMTLLRSMQKAKYSKDPIGHFGLASIYYSHFTSPIRRYPDLLLHRMIRDIILTNPNDEIYQLEKINHYNNILTEYSEHTSNNERIAINMERDVVKLKSAQYMKPFINKNFKSTIISMMPSGFYVKLENGIEGFVHIKNINSYLVYDEDHLLFYTHNGQKFRLGDEIEVTLMSVDLEELKIDFTVKLKKTNNSYKNTKEYAIEKTKSLANKKPKRKFNNQKSSSKKKKIKV